MSNPHGHNPHGPTLHGIDVAYPQGHGFDWSLVAADGIRFAWVKATQGADPRNVDPTFRRNWSEAQRAGVLRGAYHFLSPMSDPIKQADHYLHTVGTLDAVDLHPMLDVEVDHGQPATLILDYALRWTEKVEAATGRPVVIYTYPSFAVGTLKIKAGDPLGKCPLWMAHYVVDPNTGRAYNLKSPIVPAAWDSWLVWQTSGNRGPRIPGINVDVDRNVFWGDEATFREVFTLETLRAPGPEDTWPETPTGKSSQKLRAVDAAILDWSPQFDARPFVESLASDDDEPKGAA